MKVTVTDTKSKSSIAFFTITLPFFFYHTGCMRDVRLNGHSLPLDGQGTEFSTVLERRGVVPGCRSDACSAKPCLSPLYCVDLWRTHECRWTLSPTRLPTVKSFILCLNVRSLTPGVQPIRLRWWMRSKVFCIAPHPPAAPPHVVTVAPAWLTPPRTTSAAVQRASGASGVRSARSNLSVSPRSARAPS